MLKQKIKGELYTIRKITNNLERYLNIATPEEIVGGKVWYKEANDFCKSLSDKYNVSVEQAAGITSALSPQVDWDQNKKWAEQFIRNKGKGFIGNRDRTIKCKQILKVSDRDSVYSILSTTDKGGNKTKAFYCNILDPEEESIVTIDRHALAACFFRPEECRPLSDNFSKLTYNQYQFLSSCFLEKAKEVGIKGPSFQAILWLTVRRIRGLISLQEPEELVGFVQVDTDYF